MQEMTRRGTLKVPIFAAFRSSCLPEFLPGPLRNVSAEVAGWPDPIHEFDFGSGRRPGLSSRRSLRFKL
jgi:hypothetical protein